MKPLFKFLLVVFAIFFAWFIFTQPAAAGVVVHHFGDLLTQAGNSLATFLKNVSR